MNYANFQKKIQIFEKSVNRLPFKDVPHEVVPTPGYAGC